MSWLFAILGLIVGLLIAAISESSAGASAMTGTLVGFLVGNLRARIGRQDSELAALKQEMLLLQGQLTQAKAGSPADSSVSLVPEHQEHLDADLASQAPEIIAVPTLQPTNATVASTAADASIISMPSLGALEAVEAESAAAVELPAAETPPIPAAPVSPPAPRQPSIIDQAIAAARNWLLGGNTIVRVGIIVLFFGIAFLLKYATDNNMLPVEFRLAGVALAATALLVTGWRLSARRPAYGLILQGGGIGILYLTVFAATKLYHLLPAGAAFPLLVAVCVLSAFIAVRQNASSLAFMGSAGGFLAPVLLASGGGSHVMLFSYYALLNAGIFATAWFKAWRPLNLLGFAFTFVIGTAWGVTSYTPALLASTEPFLILFFLMYVAIAVLYALHREIALKHYVDGTLVFGTPLIAIGLQAGLMQGVEFGVAWSAVAMAAFYLGLTMWLQKRQRLGLMFEATLALAVVFATLAVPLAFTGPTTSAVWAIEGAAVVWISVRQQRRLALAFALLLQLAAGIAFVAGQLSHAQPHTLPVLNRDYIGMLLIALSGLFTGWRLHGRAEARVWLPVLPVVGILAAIWGLLWWLIGGFNEIGNYFASHSYADKSGLPEINSVVLFAVLTAWLAHGARRRLQWPLAELPALALVPMLALLCLVAAQTGQPPLIGLGGVVWLSAAALAYLLLWRQQRDLADNRLAPLHTLLFWTLCVLLALEGHRRLASYVPEGAWRWSAWAYVYGSLLLLLAGPGARLRWPVLRFDRAYLVWGAAPIAGLLWAWSIASVMSDGDAAPLFYLPILNPLDVAQFLVFLSFSVWLRRLKALGVVWSARALDFAALGTLFLWFNALLLRTLHHRFHAAYSVEAVFDSFSLQQVFLVGWSVFAFLGLWFARRDSLLRVFAMLSLPLIVVMWLWTFFANFTQDGGHWGRLPLLNPLDIVQMVIYAIAALWLLRVNKLGAPVAQYRRPLQIAAGATAFVWLNSMLLRTLHHWADIPYNLDDLSASTLVQASLSVFWTVCALATMIWASRRAVRPLWFTGASLLGLTVVKLFLFDLSHVTGIGRIVSFIGIGIMLLLIGYFSPLPPKAKEADA